jgi:ketosteroid isomerase-like protein
VTLTETFHAFFAAATEQRDLEAFLSLWAADEPAVTMWGSDEDEYAVGHTEIRHLAERLVASETELRFHWNELQIHERGAFGWINASGTVSAGDASHPYRVTMVLEHNYAGWRVHTFNGSIPDRS